MRNKNWGTWSECFQQQLTLSSADDKVNHIYNGYMALKYTSTQRQVQKSWRALISSWWNYQSAKAAWNNHLRKILIDDGGFRSIPLQRRLGVWGSGKGRRPKRIIKQVSAACIESRRAKATTTTTIKLLVLVEVWPVSEWVSDEGVPGTVLHPLRASMADWMSNGAENEGRWSKCHQHKRQEWRVNCEWVNKWGSGWVSGHPWNVGGGLVDVVFCGIDQMMMMIMMMMVEMIWLWWWWWC